MRRRGHQLHHDCDAAVAAAGRARGRAAAQKSKFKAAGRAVLHCRVTSVAIWWRGGEWALRWGWGRAGGDEDDDRQRE